MGLHWESEGRTMTIVKCEEIKGLLGGVYYLYHFDTEYRAWEFNDGKMLFFTPTTDFASRKKSDLMKKAIKNFNFCSMER